VPSPDASFYEKIDVDIALRAMAVLAAPNLRFTSVSRPLA
jgi:hypothetical protein